MTCQIVLSQYSSESFNDVEVDFETEEIVSDETLIQQKTELLKKINSSLLDLNQFKSERLNKIEKNKKSLKSSEFHTLPNRRKEV